MSVYPTKERRALRRLSLKNGEMAEWSKAPALKTGDVKASVGSTPTLSAKKTSTDGITGINACGDAWSSRKQEYSVGWFVVSEATTSTLGELNTCAGYNSTRK